MLLVVTGLTSVMLLIAAPFGCRLGTVGSSVRRACDALVAKRQPRSRRLSDLLPPAPVRLPRMEPEWSRAQDGAQRRAWDQVLRPVAAELATRAREMSVEVTEAIGERLPDLLPDRESFEANRASTEASILGFAQILEQGADPAGTSLGAATLAYTQEGCAPRHPADDLDAQLPARARRGLGRGRGPDRRARGRPGSASDRDRALLSVAVRVRRRGAVSRRGLLQRRARALGAEHRRDPRRDDRHDPGRRTDRRRTGKSTPGLRARPSAHRGDRVAAGTRRGARHPRRRWKPRSQRSAIASAPRARSSSRSASCRSPPGSALTTPSRPASWMTSGSTRKPRPGFGSRSANPRTASPDSARATTRPYRPAASRSSPSDRPAPSPATRASRSPRSRPPTSTRPAHSCERELRGLAADDDLTTRLTATLRTYLDEHSSRSRTAKRLGIHENTVSYRIKQAEEILGRSVDQRTLELRVALALAHLVRDQTG